MRKSKFSDNEGKCCDAALRVLEEREGRIRTNLTFPEQERHSAPVEIVCTIGKSRYALEHTKLQTYSKQIQDSVHFSNALEVLEQELVDHLPKNGWFMLVVPANAFDGMSADKVIGIRENIASWVIRVAPTMKLSARDFAVLTENLDSVPFAVSLQAIAAGPPDSHGTLKIARSAPTDLDAMRLDEIGTSLTRKLPKLKAWSDAGVKTVLVLETEDVALANHQKVLEGLQYHLPLHGYVPDHVYFVYAVGSPWLVQTLVENGSFPTDTFQWPSYREFNPGELTDICASPKTE